MKRLVPPAVTEGEWRMHREGADHFILGSDVIDTGFAEVRSYDGRPDLIVTQANARFLANSKRVAEAAAELLGLIGNLSHDQTSGFTAEDRRGIEDNMKVALIAAGYTEQESA